MDLFRTGDFIFHSGTKSDFKIDCDVLSLESWKSIARQVAKRVRFSKVIAIPRGGSIFAATLDPYESFYSSDPILIVDDVLTTGASMEEMKTKLNEHGNKNNVIGVVLFSYIKPAEWIIPIFHMWAE